MLHFDFEYHKNKYTLETLVVVSFYNDVTKVLKSFRRSDFADVKNFVNENRKETFVCFTANADLPCLITLGVDIRNLDFIDTHLLYLQLAYTHMRFLTHKPSLLNALDAFDLVGHYGENEKDDTRELILSKNEYSDAEYDHIVKYCEKDTKNLSALTAKLVETLAEYSNQTEDSVIDTMIYHGDFLIAVAVADYRNKGLPVNTSRLDDAYGNIEGVKKALAKAINDHYSKGIFTNIYTHKHTNHRDGTESDKYTFTRKAFEELLGRLNILEKWPRTESGMVEIGKDLLEAQCKQTPSLLKLYRVLRTNQDLSGKKDLRDLCFDGYIKGHPEGFWMSKPYGTKTYRSSPLPANGFILNKTPWMRVAFVEPHEGMCIVSADWASQEIAIAAALSKDPHMRDLYTQGGDIYLYTAIKAGSAPEGATKKTHGAIRSMFKVVLLGLSYGMGTASLGEKVYLSQMVDGKETISRSKALEVAEDVTAWHKDYFSIFWEWVATKKNEAEDLGYAKTLDNLLYFVNGETKPTALQNFPVQSAAGVMMREAYKLLVKANLDVICSLHDAFYITCKKGDEETVKDVLLECMAKASDITIGDYCPVTAEGKVQHHGEWFDDDRADEALETIKPLFGWDK